MKKIFCGLIFINSLVFSSFSEYLFTSKTKALGGSYVGIVGSIDSMYHNPAGLFSLKEPQMLLSGQSLWTGLVEGSIFVTALNFCYPVKNKISVGLGYINYYVSEIYKEEMGMLAMAIALSKKLLFGTNLKLLSLQYYDYPSESSLFSNYGSKMYNHSLDIGTIIMFSDKVSLGVAIFDVVQPKISIDPNVKEILHQTFKFGIGYKNKEWVISTDVSQYKDIVLLSAGVEKNFVNEDLSLRGGVNYSNRNTGFFALGFGYKFSFSSFSSQFNYTFAYPISQFSTAIGDHYVNVLLEFHKKEAPTEIQQKRIVKIEETKKSLQEKVKINVSKNKITKEDKNLTFEIDISTEIKVEGWQLFIVDNNKQNVIKAFFSSNQREQIIWDLKDENGKLVSKGKYNFMIVGVDKEGNKFESNTYWFFVADKLSEEKEKKMIICPNCGAEVMEGERFCPICRELLERR